MSSTSTKPSGFAAGLAELDQQLNPASIRCDCGGSVHKSLGDFGYRCTACGAYVSPNQRKTRSAPVRDEIGLAEHRGAPRVLHHEMGPHLTDDDFDSNGTA